jgi:hypothetical protein
VENLIIVAGEPMTTPLLDQGVMCISPLSGGILGRAVFKPVDTLSAPSGDHFTPKRLERAIGGPDIGVSSGK